MRKKKRERGTGNLKERDRRKNETRDDSETREKQFEKGDNRSNEMKGRREN